MSNDPGKNNKVTTDLVQALRQAGQELARQISDASGLQVQTFFTVVGENTEPALVASTKIELDGDTDTVIPLRREADSLVRDIDLLELHQVSVENAIAYREKLLDQILDLARQARTR